MKRAGGISMTNIQTPNQVQAIRVKINQTHAVIFQTPAGPWGYQLRGSPLQHAGLQSKEAAINAVGAVVSQAAEFFKRVDGTATVPGDHVGFDFWTGPVKRKQAVRSCLSRGSKT